MTPKEEQKYINYMTDIKNRINFLSAYDFTSIPKQITVEIIAIQFRKIVEMIIFSSLVANKEKYNAIHCDFAKHWRIKDIIKKIKGFNKDYLPIPVKEIEGDNGEKLWDYPSGTAYFTESELVEIYNESGGILHSYKPFQSNKVNIDRFLSKVSGRKDKFISTLNCHQVHPLNDKEVFIVHMSEDNRDSPVIYRFEAHRIAEKS